MDTSWLALQVERVERSVAFLRQDQLALLEGLHLEIMSLQKRCTELNCELELQPPRRTLAEVEAEEEFLLGRCEEVELRLEEEQWTVGELQQELGQKGALVRALRCSLRDEERRFLQELQLRSHRGAELRTQLRIQTEAAAYLTLQLHSARHNLHHQHLQWPPQAPPTVPQALPTSPQAPPTASALTPPTALQVPPTASALTPPTAPQVPPTASALTPPTAPQVPPTAPALTPPTALAPPAAPDLRHTLRAERARECVPRERVTAPADPTPMPDPALFLHPRRSRPRPLAEQTDGQGEGQEGEDGAMGEGCIGVGINAANTTRAHQPRPQNYTNDLDHTHQL